MMADVNGVSIHYEVKGSGPALMMLHGNSEDLTTFDEASEVLKERFTVYLVDSRGHGCSSPPPDNEHHYSDLADDLHALIMHLGVESPLICGYSDGGIVALLHAIEHPDIPSGIVACGANTSPSTLKGFGMFLLRMNRGKGDPRLRMMLCEPDISKEDLSRIACPVLSVAGSRDCVKRSDTEFIASSVQDGRTIIVPGADHGSYVMHSTVVAGIILDEFGTGLRGGFR